LKELAVLMTAKWVLAFGASVTFTEELPGASGEMASPAAGGLAKELAASMARGLLSAFPSLGWAALPATGSSL